MSGFRGFGERGFLSNYPPDVVMVVGGGGNGRVITITKGDILDGKRRRQARKLAHIRRNWEPVVRPCFVWVFCNDSWFYNGYWLYVKTLKGSWQISERRQDMVLKIMGMFPCGYEPVMENFTAWKAAFAETYKHPTKKRPDKQGMIVARAVVGENGRLLDVRPWEGEIHADA